MSDSKFPMRINKYLAHQGITTRREADLLIQKKRVYLNGRLAVLGDQVNLKDQVTVTGHHKTYQYYKYYKPRGLVTYSPDHTESDIKRQINLPGVFPIGRLDKDSEGLIILTNDGRITDRLLHPTYEHEKEYEVTTKEKMHLKFARQMVAGVDIEGYVTKPCQVKITGDYTFRIILTEGKKHQIRRMCAALGYVVSKLKRTRIMNITLGSLKPGELSPLSPTEQSKFLEQLDLKPKP